MNKKGITISGMEIVGVMIIIVVTFIFILGAGSNIISIFKGKADVEAC